MLLCRCWEENTELRDPLTLGSRLMQARDGIWRGLRGCGPAHRKERCRCIVPERAAPSTACSLGNWSHGYARVGWAMPASSDSVHFNRVLNTGVENRENLPCCGSRRMMQRGRLRPDGATMMEERAASSPASSPAVQTQILAAPLSAGRRQERTLSKYPGAPDGRGPRRATFRPSYTGDSAHSRAIRERSSEHAGAAGDTRCLWSAPCSAFRVRLAANAGSAVRATVARVSSCWHTATQIAATRRAGPVEAGAGCGDWAPSAVVRLAALFPLRPGADARAAAFGSSAPLPDVQTAEQIQCRLFLVLAPLLSLLALLRRSCIAARRDYERPEDGEGAPPRGPPP
jgi:hypothetical protein